MGKPLRDLTGLKIHRWNIIDRADRPEKTTQTGAWWNCICDCGTERVVYGNHIAASYKKASKSCGCYKKEVLSILMSKMRLKESGTTDYRFLNSFKIDSVTGCWNWLKTKDKDGYGIVYRRTRGIRAHRFSFEKYNHKIPKNSVVCHKCDNPSCVNPEHLFVGKPIDNVRDMMKKGRDMSVGSRNTNSKLTESDIPVIRNDIRSYIEISKEYGVCELTIRNVKKRKFWKHVL